MRKYLAIALLITLFAGCEPDENDTFNTLKKIYLKIESISKSMAEMAHSLDTMAGAFIVIAEDICKTDMESCPQFREKLQQEIYSYDPNHLDNR